MVEFFGHVIDGEVLEPAEDTPTSATILARLAIEAGIPAGVLNVVHGYGPDSVGSALTSHPDVDRITFTGESGTGKIISSARSSSPRRSTPRRRGSPSRTTPPTG
jgi:acyl-CoA reductase-like NAD-dependent aldehyde dehydrogenase